MTAPPDVAASPRKAAASDAPSTAEPTRLPPAGAEGVLTEASLAFVAALTRTFRARVVALLERRKERQRRLDRGEPLDFSIDGAEIRAGDWTVAPLPADLMRRRVEITGPVDRKMIINALNSGADVFMADLEDSTAPTFDNVMRGQRNLMDAVRGTIGFVDEARGKTYALKDEVAVLMVRPRGWHLEERHILVDGAPVPGALVDFGLYFFHNAKALLERGTGPYFYLPKLEAALEARLWNDVFTWSEEQLGIDIGTIKATVLIETLPASFEMDEILYALREHSAGLNCGRWDYIFSFLKKHRTQADAIFPDRGQVTMEQPFMRAYTQLVVKTCHRRRAFAIGGMAAQIPIKSDPGANERAIEKVRNDKLREAKDGHDGTWVAHPGLVPVAMSVFQDALAGKDNQLDVMRDDVQVIARDLLEVPVGTITEPGLRTNLRVGVLYLESWLRGNGCVPIDHLMEDAATAEISRTQVWQWLAHRAQLDDGRVIDAALFDATLDSVMEQLVEELGPSVVGGGRFDDARDLFSRLCTAKTCPDFLTSEAYPLLDDV